MGSNGQMIAVPLPQGTKNVHVRGLNQYNATAEWVGEPQNWGGMGSSEPWFGALTNNWWFKGDVKITYTDSAGRTQSWDCPNVPESQSNDFWTTTPDNHNGYEGYP